VGELAPKLTMSEYQGWIEYFKLLNGEEQKLNPLEDKTGAGLLKEFRL
jgi:hypothetical protein